jgi:hypothetical protein
MELRCFFDGEGWAETYLDEFMTPRVNIQFGDWNQINFQLPATPVAIQHIYGGNFVVAFSNKILVFYFMDKEFKGYLERKFDRDFDTPVVPLISTHGSPNALVACGPYLFRVDTNNQIAHYQSTFPLNQGKPICIFRKIGVDMRYFVQSTEGFYMVKVFEGGLNSTHLCNLLDDVSMFAGRTYRIRPNIKVLKFFDVQNRRFALMEGGLLAKNNGIHTSFNESVTDAFWLGEKLGLLYVKRGNTGLCFYNREGNFFFEPGQFNNIPKDIELEDIYTEQGTEVTIKYKGRRPWVVGSGVLNNDSPLGRDQESPQERDNEPPKLTSEWFKRLRMREVEFFQDIRTIEREKEALKEEYEKKLKVLDEKLARFEQEQNENREIIKEITSFAKKELEVFQCKYCLEVNQLWNSECGHVFCKKCYKEFEGSCPMCRTQLDPEEDLRRVFLE